MLRFNLNVGFDKLVLSTRIQYHVIPDDNMNKEIAFILCFI